MALQVYIKNIETGECHKYGSDRADTMMIDENGGLQYYNRDTGGSTRFPDAEYEFELDED